MTIKELRSASGMTQQQFSELLHIPKRSIENWESGARKCPDYVNELITYYLRHEGFIKEEKNMKITKLYLSGGFNFEISFDVNGENVKISHVYDNRTDATEEAETTMSKIIEIVGEKYFTDFESLNDIQISRILDALHKEGCFKRSK